jgi:hypothetical protein
MTSQIETPQLIVRLILFSNFIEIFLKKKKQNINWGYVNIQLCLCSKIHVVNFP